jgi:hypothetical protein
MVAGGAFLAVDRLHSSTADSVEHPGPAATDAQTQTEVVELARDIVAIAGLHQATAGYLLMSCKDRDDPPYQGAVYLNFLLPADISADEYFRTISGGTCRRTASTQSCIRTATRRGMASRVFMASATT